MTKDIILGICYFVLLLVYHYIFSNFVLLLVYHYIFSILVIIQIDKQWRNLSVKKFIKIKKSYRKKK